MGNRQAVTSGNASDIAGLPGAGGLGSNITITGTTTYVVTATGPNGTPVATYTFNGVGSGGTISPTNPSIAAGSAPQTFTIAPVVTVTWSITPNDAAHGAIDPATGIYTPPATLPGTPSVTVTATPTSGTASTTTITLTAVVDTSLVGYWNFDGSGASTNWSGAAGPLATLSGSVFTSTAGEFHAGQAIKNTAASNMASFTNPADMPQWTISFWGRYVDLSLVAGGVVTPRFIDANGTLVYPNGNNKALYFACGYTTGRQFKTIDNTVTPGTMQHFVITWDSSSLSTTPICYVNGVSVAVSQDVAGSGTRLSNAGAWTLLNRPAGDRAMNGSIDDLRIFNRILTPTEVAALP
ncbi:MAG: LamG domain-containing protein [bacterium]